MKTYWNGEETNCRKVIVTVEDSGFFPLYWAKDLVGQDRNAVEINYTGIPFYIDDEDGQGWAKVTEGKGSPHLSSKSLDVSNVRERLDDQK